MHVGSFPFIFKGALEKKFLELQYGPTADISEFSSLLMQGVDPNIYNTVRIIMLEQGQVTRHLVKFKS